MGDYIGECYGGCHGMLLFWTIAQELHVGLRVRDAVSKP